MTDKSLILMHATLIANAGKLARDRGVLSTWTIFDHPIDCPEAFIARRFEVGGHSPMPLATTDAIVGDLDVIRESMARVGLACITRDVNDHPNVVETWL